MSDPNDMSFLDHLEELRFRIIRSVIAIAIGTVVLFIWKSLLLDIIFGPTKGDFITYRAWCALSHWMDLGDRLCIFDDQYTLISTKAMGSFFAHMTTAIVGGVVVAFPFIFWQFWSFIKPGLRMPEIKATRGMMAAVSLLFFSGVLFGYFVLAPLSVQFLLNYNFGVENMPDLRSYTKLITALCLATGLIFQLPVLVYFLSKIGLVTPELLKKYRRHALVVVLIISAIITPPDVTSQLLVSFPVLILYEVSVVLSRRVNRKREEKLAS